MDAKSRKILRKVKKNIKRQDELFTVKCALIKYFRQKGYYFNVTEHLSSFMEDFTLNNIISAWAGYEVNIYEEEKYALCENDKMLFEQVYYSPDVSFEDATVTFLGEAYQLSLDSKERKENGIAYTPEDITEYMTDIIRSGVTIDTRLMDPACGGGYFLVGFYNCIMSLYYPLVIKDTIRQIHEKILTENIFGMDISPVACAISKITLALLHKDFFLCENIITTDSLTSTPEEFYGSFDRVVTNPPYVGVKNMQSEYKLHLKELYPDVFYDKADISYCFFELGRELLKKDGELVYVTSRYFAQSHFARGLRKMLLGSFTIKGIVDYYGVRPFSDIGIDPMIIHLRKGYTPQNRFDVVKLSDRSIRGEDILNRNTMDSNRIEVSQDELSEDGFTFLDSAQKDLISIIEDKCSVNLEDMMQLFQGIISGCDKAFVVSSANIFKNECIDECGVKWIKGKEIGEKINYYGQYLLYVTTDIRESDIKATIKHLEAYRPVLESRRECRTGSRRWFDLQWARNRDLFEQPKIVFPYKSASSKFVVDEQWHFFSADIYGMVPKEGYEEVDLHCLARLLSCPQYEDYFKSFAKKLGGELYEYYPNTVGKIRLPEVSVINTFHTQEDIDGYFGF
ncbi:MAG: N-6 DNA methylase [Eubacteriaceae bacterium]|nr:N-6 DNA methylase [Eubacteriaceae bacterium]